MDAGAPALLGSLVDQLLVTVGYSAGSVAMAATLGVTAYRRGDLFVAATVGLLALGASFAPWNRPLQTMLYMMASACITVALPMPEEPSGPLVGPSVLLYFCWAASCLWALDRAAGAHDGCWRAFLNGVAPFVVVFAGLRGVARFAEQGQQQQLVCLACCYIVLFPVAPAGGGRTWGACLTLFLDSFACQGLVLALTRFGAVVAAPAGLQLAALYALGLLCLEVLRVGDFGARVQFCKNNFCFCVSQELLDVLAELCGPPVPLLVFAAAVGALAHFAWGPCYAETCTVCCAGLSIAVAAALDAWLASVRCPLERLVVFGAAFAALQLCVDARDAGRAAEDPQAEYARTQKDASVLSAGIVDAAAAGLPGAELAGMLQ